MSAVLSVHASNLDRFLDCPRAAVADRYGGLLTAAGYEVKATVKYVTPTVGNGVHAAADFLNNDYIRTGLLPTVDMIRASAEAGFDKFMQLYAKDLEQSEVKHTVKFADNEVIRRHIAEYAQLYAEIILPTRKLELSEQFFKIPLKDGFQVESTLDGYGEKTLFDLKTGDKLTPAYAQVGMYVYLLRNAGYEVIAAQLDYIHKPKIGDPPKHTVIRYNPDDCEKIAQYATARLMIDLEEFIRTQDINVLLINPRSEACNSLMCRLYGTSSCGGWKKG
jgi:hypothetical protein